MTNKDQGDNKWIFVPVLDTLILDFRQRKKKVSLSPQGRFIGRHADLCYGDLLHFHRLCKNSFTLYHCLD